jgi:hypothetical protein
MTNKNKLIIGCVILVIVLILSPFVIRLITHSAVNSAKKEVVQEIKNVDREKAVKAIATSIHKFSDFKKDVKQRLDSLEKDSCQENK